MPRDPESRPKLHVPRKPVPGARVLGIGTLDYVLSLDPDDGAEVIEQAERVVSGVPGRASLEIAEYPPIARTVARACAFHQAVDHDGLSSVFEWLGDDFDDVVQALRTLGAETSVRYLEALRTHLPDGRMPDDERARLDLMAHLHDTDVIEPLDDELRDDVLDEVPRRVQEYLAEHRAAFEAESSAS